MQQSIRRIWAQAQEIDPTLKFSPSCVAELARRQMKPVSFSRERMFTAMRKGSPVLFHDLPLPVEGEKEVGVGAAVLRALVRGFPPRQKILTRCGPSGTATRLTVDELVRRWISGRCRINVTDLHIRSTDALGSIDCTAISEFNLLANARGRIGREEMLTVVVSSQGAVSDSHSDDPDGTNHSFVGRKLWLAWDTFQGLSHNLEDLSRSEVPTRASFSIRDFLSVPGSQWFIVEPRQTLFLPGSLTHKVITLEDYLGIGSFFVTPSSYFRTLLRWTKHTPIWALNSPNHRRLEVVDQITSRVTRKVKLLKSATRRERSRWGIEHLQSAVKSWEQHASEHERRQILANPASAELLRTVLAL